MRVILINIAVISIVGVLAYFVIYTSLANPEIFNFNVKRRINKIARMNEIIEVGGSDGYSNKRDEKGGAFSFIKVSNTLKRNIYSSGIKLRPEEFIIIWFAVTFLPAFIYTLINGLNFYGIGILVVCFFAPLAFLDISKKRRIAKFNEQLNDSLAIISNSLRAGFTFRHALARVSEDLPNPISEEFKRVIREVNYGAKVEDSLGALAVRMGSKELAMINSAVVIQQKTGGNLAEIIEKVNLTISDRIKMHNQIRALTAQGRISGLIMALLPLAIGLILMIVNPEYISVFFTTTIGIISLIFSIIWEFIGFLFIKKLVDIKF